MSKLFQSASVSFTTIFSASQQRVWRAEIQYQFYLTGTTWSLVWPLQISNVTDDVYTICSTVAQTTRVPEQPFMIIKCKKIWCCANRSRDCCTQQDRLTLWTAGYLARSAGEKSFNFCGGMFRTVQLVFCSRQLSSPLYSTQLNWLYCSSLLQCLGRKESGNKIKCS